MGKGLSGKDFYTNTFRMRDIVGCNQDRYPPGQAFDLILSNRVGNSEQYLCRRQPDRSTAGKYEQGYALITHMTLFLSKK